MEILGEFVPPRAKGQVFFLDRSSTCLKHSIYEAFYPVTGFESGFTGFIGLKTTSLF
jgi:hypothetical protein